MRDHNYAWTYDNLNRMTASPGHAYENDILGNRTSRDVSGNNRTLYAWDALNRMTFTNGYTAQYRADGMRVMKDPAFLVWNNGNWSVGRQLGAQSTWFCYDGQMPVEEFTGLYVTEPKKYSRNAVGARGIDMVETWEEGSQAVRAYPLYDAHGNNVATLTKGSGTTYTVGNRRTYDAWGAVRSGSTAGKAKYVANLGHVEDEESGLVYMRARYYEPSSGRFVSEDPAMDGRNWFVYCELDPINRLDSSGKSDESEAYAWIGSVLMLAGLVLMGSGVGVGATRATQYVRKLIADWKKIRGWFHPQTPALVSIDMFVQLVYYGLIEEGQPNKLAVGGLKGAATAIAGYGVMQYGVYLWAIAATDADPYAANEGRFGLL